MSVKCSRCKSWLPPNEFMSNDRIVKYCFKCREKQKEYDVRHAEERRAYREDRAEEIRAYNKGYREDHAEERRARDKTYREDRKMSDPLNTKFKHMINHSIQADTKSNRPYDRPDYIDELYLNYLWSEQGKRCHYCKCEMTLDFNATNRNPTQISIQRLNNDLPHIKTNCVLACFLCNVSHRERTAV